MTCYDVHSITPLAAGLAIAVASCGGKAVIDDGIGAGGNTVTTTTTTTGTSTSSTTTTTTSSPPACGDAMSCCEQLCDLVQQLQCVSEAECDCSGIEESPPMCLETLQPLYACFIDEWPDIMICSEGIPWVNCSLCVEEIGHTEIGCGATMGCYQDF